MSKTEDKQKEAFGNPGFSKMQYAEVAENVQEKDIAGAYDAIAKTKDADRNGDNPNSKTSTQKNTKEEIEIGD